MTLSWSFLARSPLLPFKGSYVRNSFWFFILITQCSAHLRRSFLLQFSLIHWKFYFHVKYRHLSNHHEALSCLPRTPVINLETFNANRQRVKNNLALNDSSTKTNFLFKNLFSYMWNYLFSRIREMWRYFCNLYRRTMRRWTHWSELYFMDLFTFHCWTFISNNIFTLRKLLQGTFQWLFFLQLINTFWITFSIAEQINSVLHFRYYTHLHATTEADRDPTN